MKLYCSNKLYFEYNFVSDGGKLYCYGFFDPTKVKHQKNYIEPRLISEHLVTRIAKCGSTFVVFVTGNNVLFFP